jgi:hypothetical protein
VRIRIRGAEKRQTLDLSANSFAVIPMTVLW